MHRKLKIFAILGLAIIGVAILTMRARGRNSEKRAFNPPGARPARPLATACW